MQDLADRGRTLTPARLRALHTMRQKAIQWPGCFSLAPRGLGAQCAWLARRGLLERRGLQSSVITSRRRRSSRGHRRTGSRRVMYRLTDRGRALTPPPVYPPAVIQSHLPRALNSEHRSRVAHRLYSGWTSDTRERVTWRGDRGVLWVEHDGSAVYSAQSMAADRYDHLRLAFPDAVVDGITLVKRRGRTWIALRFHFAGEVLPLLPAPEPVLYLPAPKQAPLALPAVATTAVWPLSLCPADDSDETAVWRGLSAEAQAALLVLYQVQPDEPWQRLEGVSDAAKRALDLELLVFWTRDRELRITARGIDLVEAVRAPEVIA